jgi:hypothetical protein
LHDSAPRRSARLARYPQLPPARNQQRVTGDELKKSSSIVATFCRPLCEG